MAIKDQYVTDEYALYQGDCIETLKEFPSDSIHFSLYSPPFGGLYHYSSDERDMSNSDNYEDFFKHYEFLIKEKYRITIPGRLTAVHCMDIPKSNTGRGDGLIEFPDDIIKAHKKYGWEYAARFTIWKEPLGVRNRTMAKNLAHKTIVEDSTKCGNAGADYIVVFRKPGENPEPVTHENGIMYYAGEKEMPSDILQYRGYTGKQTENKYSHWIWRQYASSVWDDIRINNVLPFKPGKDDKDEKHVHPLQLDVIDRLCELFTNVGDKVLDPFNGVGSTTYGAVSYGRFGIGMELKDSYFQQSIKNMQTVKNRFKDTQQKLF